MNLCLSKLRQLPSQQQAGQSSDAPRIFILLNKAAALATALDQLRAPVGEMVQEQMTCICKTCFCSHKGLSPSEEPHPEYLFPASLDWHLQCTQD